MLYHYPAGLYGARCIVLLLFYLEVLFREDLGVASGVTGFGIWCEMYCSISVFYYGLLFREDVGFGSGVTCYITTLQGYRGEMYCSTSVLLRTSVQKGCSCI